MDLKDNRFENLLLFSFLFVIQPDLNFINTAPEYLIDKMKSLIDMDSYVSIENDTVLDPWVRIWKPQDVDKYHSIYAFFYHLTEIRTIQTVPMTFINLFTKYVGDISLINTNPLLGIHPNIRTEFGDYLGKYVREFKILKILNKD